MAPGSLVVTMENPNFSVLEINGPSSMEFPEKQKAKNTKQFTWVLFLKAHRAISCLSWLVTSLWAMLAAAKKRIVFSDRREEPKSRRRLLGFIKAFLLLSMAALVFEVIAHFEGWNLGPIQPLEVQSLVHWTYLAWMSFRADYIAPVVVVLSKFCVFLFMLQSLDRLLLCLGCFWIKYKNLKPKADGKAYDIEDSSVFPMVLVQIPMCNEREVRELNPNFSLNFLSSFCFLVSVVGFGVC